MEFRRSLIPTLNIRDYYYAVRSAVILHFMGNFMGLQTFVVRKICGVFITNECSVFIVWKFIYQSDAKHCGTFFGNMDDGDKIATYSMCQNGQITADLY